MPTLYLFSGPNGAGKTTIALRHVEREKKLIFLNADIIANQLDPKDVDKQAIPAGRIMLKELKKYISKAELDIAFESTLSSKSFVNIINKSKRRGYKFFLIFISLKNYELACARVLQRVENGGHNIPEEIIIRRFKKGRDNLKKYTYP
jgi:predicted ABC-type ATPase